MDEIFIVGLLFGGIISLMLSLVLLKMGKMIDAFPVEDGPEREITMWSPVEFTRIFVGLFWIFFLVGGYMVYLGTRIMLVMGIATLAGMLLFLITALVFSIATFNLMRTQKNKDVSQASILSTIIKPTLNPGAFITEIGKKKYKSSRTSKNIATGNDNNTKN
ncbi:MAG TPA: hypothetical protein VMW63_08775 [Methanoregulaceae archaeon]|nr:hypothetical protein [Methanoregulaceae archaeon]